MVSTSAQIDGMIFLLMMIWKMWYLILISIKLGGAKVHYKLTAQGITVSGINLLQLSTLFGLESGLLQQMSVLSGLEALTMQTLSQLLIVNG